MASAINAPRRVVLGRYDAAATTEENRRHWANADHLSANAANNPTVRRILRARARYEVANNSYARGIVLTLANDVVGTGPRLQLLTEDDTANRTVEQAFVQWAQAVRLAEKLRTLRMARAESGEVFALLTANPAVDSAVKLDLRLIEADQIATPVASLSGGVDGIVFDAYGNPLEYHLLRAHPGDGSTVGTSLLGFDRIPAGAMLHYFRTDRPGQNRGIPEITPALPLFAQLRRYTLAVIAAADYNAFVDAAMEHRRRTAALDQNPLDMAITANRVLVRNDTGSVRGRFDVLGINGVVVSPADNEESFLRQVIFKGVNPTDFNHQSRFVVLAEPLANDKIGRAYAAPAICTTAVR